ncbi:uncharacterized protein VTP21DRAFT_7097 [Calcarisporiella thermophila]|uniref:uncharacterized protein n=1 Tax=Calcarisporiella thermophila TaxID=911321 RepID=UPI003741F616
MPADIFTEEDERVLREWMRARSGGIQGNNVYKELAKLHPHHSWKQWRDLYEKYRSRQLNLTRSSTSFYSDSWRRSPLRIAHPSITAEHRVRRAQSELGVRSTINHFERLSQSSSSNSNKNDGEDRRADNRHIQEQTQQQGHLTQWTLPDDSFEDLEGLDEVDREVHQELSQEFMRSSFLSGATAGDAEDSRLSGKELYSSREEENSGRIRGRASDKYAKVLEKHERKTNEIGVQVDTSQLGYSTTADKATLVMNHASGTSTEKLTQEPDSDIRRQSDAEEFFDTQEDIAEARQDRRSDMYFDNDMYRLSEPPLSLGGEETYSDNRGTTPNDRSHRESPLGLELSASPVRRWDDYVANSSQTPPQSAQDASLEKEHSRPGKRQRLIREEDDEEERHEVALSPPPITSSPILAPSTSKPNSVTRHDRSQPSLHVPEVNILTDHLRSDKPVRPTTALQRAYSELLHEPSPAEEMLGSFSENLVRIQRRKRQQLEQGREAAFFEEIPGGNESPEVNPPNITKMGREAFLRYLKTICIHTGHNATQVLRALKQTSGNFRVTVDLLRGRLSTNAAKRLVWTEDEDKTLLEVGIRHPSTLRILCNLKGEKNVRDREAFLRAYARSNLQSFSG